MGQGALKLAVEHLALDVGSTGMDTDARAPDPATSHQSLAQLEQAIRDQAEWHENLLRAVVCGLSFDLNDLTERAHFQCRWALVLRARSCRGPGNRRSQRSAWSTSTCTALPRSCCGTWWRTHRSCVEDFEELVAAGMRLRLELDALRQECRAGYRPATR